MTRAERTLPLLVIALLATAAHAGPGDAGSNAAAEVLFREGRQLLKDHRIAEACTKLEASNRLATSTGTLLNLADCREQNRQLATAWSTFLEAAKTARIAGDASRESEARRRAAALEPRLSYLTISVPESSRVAGLAISRDGTVVDPALWNQGVPIDAGAHEISGSAPGHEPWTTKVQLDAEGQKSSVEVPRFKQLADLGKVLAPTTVAPAAAHGSDSGDDDDDSDRARRPGRFTTTRKVSIGVAAAGVVTLGSAIGFGLEAKHLQSQSEVICPATSCGDPHGLDLNWRARTDATASEVLFAAGGVAVAGAAVLWFVGAPRAARDRVTVAPVVGGDRVGFALGTSF